MMKDDVKDKSSDTDTDIKDDVKDKSSDTDTDIEFTTATI